MKTIRLTTAQALVRYLTAQRIDSGEAFVAGVWAIFGHGNVAALGDALHASRSELPTWRGHNEQAMAHAALAFAKANNRRRIMAVTTSIGPGATNLITAAASAHVNRLPVLLLPADVFASRRPDPVLQQLEDFADGSLSVNDCFRPVSRYFDRITRPEQLLRALPAALAVLTDPAQCGPATLSLCQDVQAEAFDWPEDFFAGQIVEVRRPRVDRSELERAARALREAKHPLVVVGGGVHYSGAVKTLRAFVEQHNLPVAETQAGKSALPWDHPLNLGAIGVTGSTSANEHAAKADRVFAVGTRLQDFTTGSWSLFQNPDMRIVHLNVNANDSAKGRAIAMVGDAREGLLDLSERLADWRAQGDFSANKAGWDAVVDQATAATVNDGNQPPSDAQVLGAVQRATDENSVVVCAAGGLPGELHKLWRASVPNSYHVEYGYSCMGYEIAGGLGVKMALPDREVVVVVGDGSYLMMNSEIATACMLGLKLIVVVLDNRGFGCINRLQMACGADNFNNLLADAERAGVVEIDFAAHAAALGAVSEKVDTLDALERALATARQRTRTSCVVIETDPLASTQAGGHWWDVVVPEVSQRAEVLNARSDYEQARNSAAGGHDSTRGRQ